MVQWPLSCDGENATKIVSSSKNIHHPTQNGHSSDSLLALTFRWDIARVVDFQISMKYPLKMLTEDEEEIPVVEESTETHRRASTISHPEHLKSWRRKLMTLSKRIFHKTFETFSTSKIFSRKKCARVLANVFKVAINNEHSCQDDIKHLTHAKFTTMWINAEVSVKAINNISSRARAVDPYRDVIHVKLLLIIIFARDRRWAQRHQNVTQTQTSSHGAKSLERCFFFVNRCWRNLSVVSPTGIFHPFTNIFDGIPMTKQRLSAMCRYHLRDLTSV